MLKMTWKELSATYQSHKAVFILVSNSLTMCHCSWCIADDMTCVMSDVSNSCALYYWHNCSCDLMPLTLKLTHTLHKKEWVNKELLAAEAKAVHS